MKPEEYGYKRWQPHKTLAEKKCGKTYEECLQKYWCESGEECWFDSEDYWYDCGEGCKVNRK